jgi:hypothetical protein
MKTLPHSVLLATSVRGPNIAPISRGCILPSEVFIVPQYVKQQYNDRKSSPRGDASP